ncbi:hypothetical protein AVEN_153430-1 [Araneus ventricosus]|uniref:Uncharacterized protein n=1 Tax=Araneus ventricosus TaxID=182803 RepID=A0A4Y2EAC4_ARAVE|nr:hypothetical protein AVEN_153430-1 [Araneus ventricosus]
MTRTTPELSLPSPNFRTTPAGGRLASAVPKRATDPIHGGSSVDSVFEPLGSEIDTLPLSHRGLLHNAYTIKETVNVFSRYLLTYPTYLN